MIKRITHVAIAAYQKIFSIDQGLLARAGILRKRNICVFYPSCSEYAKLAVQKYGFFRGAGKTLLRVARCHPWQKNHIDMP